MVCTIEYSCVIILPIRLIVGVPLTYLFFQRRVPGKYTTRITLNNPVYLVLR